MKTKLLAKIAIAVGLLMSVGTAYADRTTSPLPLGMPGYVLQSLGNLDVDWVATSSLGITGGGGGGGWTFASSTIWGLFSNTATGITYNNTTGSTTLTAGYSIPLTASTTQWNSLYNASTTFYLASNPSGYITSTALSPYMTLSYGSSTYASTSWVVSTFAPKATPTFTGLMTLVDASSTGVSTLPTIFNTTRLNIRGLFSDSINATGTSGQVLQSTGTSTLWSTITGFITNSYASSTFPSFGYASSTFATVVAPSFSGVMTFANASGTTATIGTLYATNTIIVSGNTSFSGTTIHTGASNTFGVSSTSVATIGQLFATSTSFFASSTVNGTLTVNGAIVSRVVGYSSAASTTINADNTDQATTTINQVTTFVNFTGTPYDGQMVQITAMATTTFNIFWGTAFGSSTDLQLPSSMASGTMQVLLQYDKYRTRWWLLGLLKSFN